VSQGCKRDLGVRDRVETETFDFQYETRPRPRPSRTLPRPRRDRDLQVLGPRRDRDRDVERPRPRRFSRRWHFGLPKQSLLFLLLARYVTNVAKGSTWEQCIGYIEDRGPTDDRSTDRPHILEKFEQPYLGNGSSDRLRVWFYRVGFSGTADRMDLLPVVPNPRFGPPPSWKISNDHISGMSYPIHFRELQSSFGGVQEKIMQEE